MIMDDNERYKNQLKKTNVRIHDHSTMHNFLKQNMPGKWSPMHITKLVQRLPGNERFLIKETGMTECVKTVEDEVKRLLEVVNLSEICSILDPHDGTGCITKYLKKHLNSKTKIVSNDICPEHNQDGSPDLMENSLNDKLYIENGPFDVIITSPWFVMLDVAIPFMLKYCKYFLACHVPSYYVLNPPEPRLAYLKKLSREKRIFVISSMTKDNPTRQSCIWLIILKSNDTQLTKKFVKISDHVIPFIY